MPKKETLSDLALAPRKSGATLFRWLYDELRTAIVDGRLKPGSRLPSSRSISRQHRIARGTVVSAFEQLTSEGYLVNHVGSGSYVKGIVPDGLLRATREKVPERIEQSRATLSARGRCLSGFPFFPIRWTSGSSPAFRVGQPALNDFPTSLWSRIAARRLRGVSASMLSRGDVLGYRPLRVEIANYLGSYRGIKCTPDEVVITTGTQGSLDLICRMLLDRHDKIWVENPGYPGASALFRASGLEVVPVPVDAEGLDCKNGRRLCENAKLAYITPAYQFPLGVTMSLSRRLEMLQWAQSVGAWILEDDYDGEFRFADRPLVALRSLDTSGCVIYSNTFNKVLFPTLRLGYLVVPPRLIEPIAAAKAVIDRFPGVLEQAILCDFIAGGYLGQHIRRMREIYASRLEVLVEGAKRDLAGLLELSPAGAGMHTIGWLADGIDDNDAYELALSRGIEVIPLSKFSEKPFEKQGLVLGFASSDVRALRRGVTGLAGVLRELKRGKKTKS
jgi:GntR family transcriptional regulator / MocR family aminotransferase